MYVLSRQSGSFYITTTTMMMPKKKKKNKGKGGGGERGVIVAKRLMVGEKAELNCGKEGRKGKKHKAVGKRAGLR